MQSSRGDLQVHNGQASRVGPAPAAVVDAAVRLGLSGVELATLRQLYRLQMRYGRLPCIRYAVLATEVGYHHGSVRRAVRTLERHGLVTRFQDHKRPGSRNGQIGQMPNRFVVHWRAVFAAVKARLSMRRGGRKAGAHPCAPDPGGPGSVPVVAVCVDELAEPPPTELTAAPPVAGPGAVRALLARRRHRG